MAVKRARIEATPSSTMHSAKGVKRENANVEAEVGETMLAKSDTGNVKELVGIGGKKHGSGGTPLSLDGGTAIFSDRLKIKDPVILKFFNESGKKDRTFAEISKKYKTSKYLEELENEDNDKIRIDSLTKNIDDANFKLSALFTMQEFHEKKGAPEEHSEHFEPFMKRMGLSYEDIFGVQGNQEVPEFTPLPEQGSGGLVKMNNGGRAPGEGGGYKIPQAYGKPGIERLNFLRGKVGLEPIDYKYIGDKKYIDKKAGEFQEAFSKNPELVADYMLNSDNSSEKSDRPNNKMQRALLEKGFKPANPSVGFTNAELQAFYNEGAVDKNFLADNFQDDLWTYRGAYTDVKTVSKEEWDEIQQDLKTNGIQASDGNIYRWMGDDLYEAYRVLPDGTYEKIEPDPKVKDEVHQWNLQHINEEPTDRNMDFRWDHKRALSQARKNKNTIPRLEPFTAIPDTAFVDQAYYNPDQAIAATQSIVQGQGQKQAMHAGPQAQMSNFLAGQQFDVISRIISAYEDKNVAAYNQENLMNTQIANRRNENLASAITGHHDKTTILKQEYSNARKNADNNIAENEIAMWNERRNRMNLEATIGEQFATNPNTGLHSFVKGKDFYPTSGTQTDIADTFADLKHKLPGVSDAEINKMAMAIHSGKYEVQTNTNPPNEKEYKY